MFLWKTQPTKLWIFSFDIKLTKNRPSTNSSLAYFTSSSFFSISDKAGLHWTTTQLDQLKVIIATFLVQASLNLSNRTLGQKGKGNNLCWEHIRSFINWIRHTIFFYSFTCVLQIFVRILPKWSKTRYLKADALQVLYCVVFICYLS